MQKAPGDMRRRFCRGAARWQCARPRLERKGYYFCPANRASPKKDASRFGKANCQRQRGRSIHRDEEGRESKWASIAGFKTRESRAAMRASLSFAQQQKACFRCGGGHVNRRTRTEVFRYDRQGFQPWKKGQRCARAREAKL